MIQHRKQQDQQQIQFTPNGNTINNYLLRSSHSGIVVIGGIDFHRINIGKKRVVKFTLANTNSKPFIVTNLYLQQSIKPILNNDSSGNSTGGNGGQQTQQYQQESIFSIIQSNIKFPITIPPMMDFESSISFSPTHPGRFTALLSITSEDYPVPRIQQISLHGEGDIPSSPSQIIYTDNQVPIVIETPKKIEFNSLHFATNYNNNNNNNSNSGNNNGVLTSTNQYGWSTTCPLFFDCDIDNDLANTHFTKTNLITQNNNNINTNNNTHNVNTTPKNNHNNSDSNSKKKVSFGDNNNNNNNVQTQNNNNNNNNNNINNNNKYSSDYGQFQQTHKNLISKFSSPITTNNVTMQNNFTNDINNNIDDENMTSPLNYRVRRIEDKIQELSKQINGNSMSPNLDHYIPPHQRITGKRNQFSPPTYNYQQQHHTQQQQQQQQPHQQSNRPIPIIHKQSLPPQHQSHQQQPKQQQPHIIKDDIFEDNQDESRISLTDEDKDMLKEMAPVYLDKGKTPNAFKNFLKPDVYDFSPSINRFNHQTPFNPRTKKFT